MNTTRLRRANGFSTFLVKASNGKELMLRGYQSYETFNQVIKQITGGDVAENKVEANEETILNFISKYGRVAPVEIEVTVNLTQSVVKEYLDKLQSQNSVSITPAGNGYFVSIKANPLLCDSENGLCNI